MPTDQNELREALDEFEYGIAHRSDDWELHRSGMTCQEAHDWIDGWVADGGAPDAFRVMRRRLGAWAAAASPTAEAEDYKAKYEALAERYGRNKAACCRARGRLMLDAVASARRDAEPSVTRTDCAACDGHGERPVIPTHEGDGRPVLETGTCPDCDGHGYIERTDDAH